MARVSAFIAGLVAVAAAFGTNAAPLKIRIQYATVSQFVPLIPVAPKELYKHYGKSYVVEPVFMAGAGPALTAFAAKDLDLAALNPQTLGNAVASGHLDAVGIVSVLTTDVPGYKGGEYWCRAPIKKIEDIRGHTIAINTRGSTPEAAARILLGRHGMEAGKDYQPVEMPFPASLPALESKRVDCAVLVAPWVNIVAKRPGVNMVFKIGDVFGETESTSWFGRPEWIKEHRVALVDFVEDHIRMRRWCLDPKTHGEAIKLAAKVAKQSPEALSYLWTHDDNYHEPNGIMNVARFQRNLDDLHKYGLITGAVGAKTHIDTSIAEEAKARAALD